MPGALGVGVLGGFVVTSESAGRCVIAHYERYDLPSWLSPLSTLARPYLRRAMSRELRALARLICRSATAGAPPVPRDAPVGPFLNSPLFAANPRGRAGWLFTKRRHHGA